MLCISDRERREIDLALEKLAATYNRGGDGIRDDDSDDDNGGVPGARRASTQRRVVPLNAERIPVHNSEAVRAHLLREGYVVVSGVADASSSTRSAACSGRTSSRRRRIDEGGQRRGEPKGRGHKGTAHAPFPVPLIWVCSRGGTLGSRSSCGRRAASQMLASPLRAHGASMAATR